MSQGTCQVSSRSWQKTWAENLGRNECEEKSAKTSKTCQPFFGQDFWKGKPLDSVRLQNPAKVDFFVFCFFESERL